jgi:hypothetical protein
MSVENILKTGFRTWFKAVKMTPGHYLTLAKIFYNHKTTNCGWKKQVEDLLASNKEKLTPFINEFEYAIDYHFGTTLFGTQAWFDKQYGRERMSSW